MYEKILNEYYDNNAFKLRRMVDKIMFKRHGGTTDKDMDEFYSVANDVVTDIIQKERYDESKGSFAGFLYKSLELAIIDELKRQNRDKRTFKIEIEIDGNKKKIPIKDIYIDAPLTEYESMTIGDTIRSDFNIDEELLKEMGCSTNETIKDYLMSLSDIQQRIAELIMQGYRASEIKEILNLTEKEYTRHLSEMKRFEKSSILKRVIHIEREDKKMNAEAQVLEEETNNNTQTTQKSITDKITVLSIMDDIETGTLCFNHPFQREANQWSLAMKSDLIADILQKNPIPPLTFAEQVRNGVHIIWGLDGKQRITTIHSYIHNGYTISKNVECPIIKYHVLLKDENGFPMRDEEGFNCYEAKEFDIRGKKFSELPKELQNTILKYTFQYVQYLNCTSDEIAYHMRRYNKGKLMNPSQKGLSVMTEKFVVSIKNISKKSFFQDLGDYGKKRNTNGALNRVVLESLSTINFLDNWKKEYTDMCKFASENVTNDMLDTFKNIVERITNVGTKETFCMFNTRDSLIWFALFSRFMNSGLNDEKFIEFMHEFSQTLHSKVVDGQSYDDLNTKSTKDKKVIIDKLEHLEKLMNEFLHINKDTTENEQIIDEETFISESVGIDKDIVKSDIELYNQTLDDLESVAINTNSKLLDKRNRLSLLAMVAYSYKEDDDLEGWLTEYARNNNTYFSNQKENYLYMRSDFEKFIRRKAV